MSPGATRLFNLDEAMKHWSEIRDHLASYLVEVNSGRHGRVAPTTDGIYAIFRRYMQTALFAELGIASKNEYSIGIVLNPVIDGEVSSYAIPVTISQPTKRHKPDVRYTTFGYEAWGQSHDQLVHNLTANPNEISKQLVSLLPMHDIQFERVTPESMTSEFSDDLNKLMLSTLRKYVMEPGPHSYNMPLIQATLFDAGLNPAVYQRYKFVWGGELIGYFVAEVTDNMFTITHCIVNRERLDLIGYSLFGLLTCLLRQMMNSDPNMRFKVLHRSKLIDQYMMR